MFGCSVVTLTGGGALRNSTTSFRRLSIARSARAICFAVIGETVLMPALASPGSGVGGRFDNFLEGGDGFLRTFFLLIAVLVLLPQGLACVAFQVQLTVAELLPCPLML